MGFKDWKDSDLHRGDLTNKKSVVVSDTTQVEKARHNAPQGQKKAVAVDSLSAQKNNRCLCRILQPFGFQEIADNQAIVEIAGDSFIVTIELKK